MLELTGEMRDQVVERNGAQGMKNQGSWFASSRHERRKNGVNGRPPISIFWFRDAEPKNWQAGTEAKPVLVRASEPISNAEYCPQSFVAQMSGRRANGATGL